MPFVPPERFSNRQWSMGVRGPRREKASPGKSSPARFLKDAWVLARRGRGSLASPGRRNSTCQGPEERKGDQELPINGGQDVSTWAEELEEVRQAVPATLSVGTPLLRARVSEPGAP